MELIILVVCTVTAWVFAFAVDALPNLGRLLVPSPWLLGGFALVVVTWLMRD